MKISKPYLIYNVTLVYERECKYIDNSALLIENSIIKEIFFDKSKWSILLDNDNIETFDGEKNILAPGLIDMHIHGCKGFDTSFANKEEALLNMAKTLEENGITTFQPTLLYDYNLIKDLALAINNNQVLKSYIPGLYIEGPFINEKKKGGIPDYCISESNIEKLNSLLDIKINNKCAIKTMTIAPEIKGINPLINILNKNNIVIALGHSDANLKDLPKLEKYHFTHLFNAMSSINHKNPGIAIFPFINNDKESVTCELIGDGIHVDNDVMRFAFNCLNDKQVCLISDSMKFSKMGKGKMIYCNKLSYCDGKACYYRDNNTLIGSCTLISDSAKSLLKKKIITKELFFKIAAVNPAKVLNLTNRGSIRVKNIADLVLYDKDFNVIKVFKQNKSL